MVGVMECVLGVVVELLMGVVEWVVGVVVAGVIESVGGRCN